MGADWSGAKNAVLGNWNLHAIFQKRTGFAFTVYDGAGQSLQATRSIERPDRLCDGKTNASGPNDIWVDIKCFAHAPVGQFGNAGHNIMTDPPYWNLDLALGKDFYIDDKRYITLRVEAFNALNHPNFGAPNSDISDPTSFGKINGTFNPPRIVELVAKFTY